MKNRMCRIGYFWDLYRRIAEDNDLNAEIAVELLKSEGAECDVAEDGQKSA